MTYEKLSKVLWTAGLDWTSDTIKAALLAPTYTVDQYTHEFWSDVNADEVSSAGYTAGGATVTGTTIIDSDSGAVIIDCDDLDWTGVTFTVRYIVFYKDTGTSSTSPLICCVDLEADITITASVFSLIVPPTGFIISYTG